MSKNQELLIACCKSVSQISKCPTASTEMGFFDKLANLLGLKRCECNVLVVGLDNSGKTTVLNHFKPDEQKHLDIVPTVGFNVEKFKSRFIIPSSIAPPRTLAPFVFLLHLCFECH